MTATIEKRINKLLSKQKREWLERDKGDWFPYKGKPAKEYNHRISRLKELLTKELDPSVMAALFDDLHPWYLTYSQFLALSENKQSDEQQHHFILSSYIAFILCEYAHRTPEQFEGMLSVSRTLAQCAVCGWDKEVVMMGDNMIASIAQDDPDTDEIHNSIQWGENWLQHSWFILDLYCASTGKSYHQEHAEKPDSYIPYGEALKHWNTDDLTLVDQLCFQLAERHLDLIEGESIEVVPFWPYEVDTWFYFRRKVGLSNPETLSHPLFHQVLAKPLTAERPFEYPSLEYLHLKTLFNMYETEYPDDEPVMDLLPPNYQGEE